MRLRQKKLKADVRIRWNSTYVILKVCEGYGVVITNFNTESKDSKNVIFFLQIMIGNCHGSNKHVRAIKNSHRPIFICALSNYMFNFV